MTWAFTLFAFLLLLGVYGAIRAKGRLNIVDFAMFFIVLRYGPHVLFIPDIMAYVSLGRYTPAEYNTYVLILGLAYLGLAGGLYFGKIMMPQAFEPISMTVFDKNDHQALRQKLIWIGLVYLGLFAIASLALDANGFMQRIIESLRYLLNTSDFTYNQIRRELFAESASIALLSRSRYSLTVGILACLFAVRKSGRLFDPIDGLVVIIFVVCAITLNKQIFFHYVILYFLVRLFYSQIILGRKLKIGTFVWLALGAVALMFFILLLYSIQYRENIATGISSQIDFIRTLAYRVFYTSGDAVQLVLATYPNLLPHTGFNNIGLFTSLFGLEYRDPTIEMVVVHLGNALTTIQPGFVGSSFAAFGAEGVLMNSLLVGLLISFWERVKHYLKQPQLVVAYMASISLSSYFLTSPQFHLSLLTGGGLVIPFFFVMLSWWLNRNSKKN